MARRLPFRVLELATPSIILRMKEYLLKHTSLFGHPAYLVSDNPRRWSDNTNYLVYEIQLENPKIPMMYIHDLDAQGDGRGTVLMARTMQDAILCSATRVKANFLPRGIREQTQTWYERRGIELLGIDELEGDVQTILGLCTQILARHGTTYRDL